MKRPPSTAWRSIVAIWRDRRWHLSLQWWRNLERLQLRVIMQCTNGFLKLCSHERELDLVKHSILDEMRDRSYQVQSGHNATSDWIKNTVELAKLLSPVFKYESKCPLSFIGEIETSISLLWVDIFCKAEESVTSCMALTKVSSMPVAIEWLRPSVTWPFT